MRIHNLLARSHLTTLALGVALLAATARSADAQNLLVNGNAETGDLTGWTDALGNGFTVSSNPLFVHAGVFSFTPGIFGPSGPWSHELRQDVALSGLAAAVDAGSLTSRFSGFGRSNESGGVVDPGSVILEFRDAGGNVLQSFASGMFTPFNAFVSFVDSRSIPIGTRVLRVRLLGQRTVGLSTDCFFDDMILRVDSTTSSYCTAKTNSLGCIPSISASGISSATAASGFTLTAANELNNKVGLVLYSEFGRDSSAFGPGGLLCVKAPTRRSKGFNAGGNPAPANDCSGIFSIDFNAFARGLLGTPPNPAAYLSTAGQVVTAQFWGRDPGIAVPNNFSLSNGLEFTVSP